MNGKNKVISTLSVIFLSVLLLAVSPLPAMAKRRESRRLPAHRSRSGERDRDRASSRLSLGFGFGSDFSNSANRRWVPGHYETRTEKILVEPGHYERRRRRVQVEPGRYNVRHIPAVSRTRRGQRGKKYEVVIQPARTERVWVPSRYKKRKVKVWVPDRYEIREVKVWIPGHWITKPARSPGRFWLNLGGLFRF